MRRRISPSDFIVVPLAIFLLLVFTAAHAQRTTRQDTAQPVAQQRNTLLGAAKTAWDKGQWEKAVASYKSFVDQNPFHPLAAEAHSKIGEYLSYVASPEEAIAEYDKRYDNRNTVR